MRGADEIEDPLEVVGKGRSKNKRLKSMEQKGRQLKCGRCSEKGHNSRTCQQ
jgi:hypothetical protein